MHPRISLRGSVCPSVRHVCTNAHITEKAAAWCQWQATAKMTRPNSHTQHTYTKVPSKLTKLQCRHEERHKKGHEYTTIHTHAHTKNAAKMNEKAVPGWRGLTEKTQTHRHIHRVRQINMHTHAHAQMYTQIHHQNGARAVVPRDASDVWRDQTRFLKVVHTDIKHLVPPCKFIVSLHISQAWNFHVQPVT